MDGRVVRIQINKDEVPTSEDVVTISRVGKQSAECDTYSYETEKLCGRPLGMEMDPKGGLYVIDTYQGLLHVQNVFQEDIDWR